jgi:hypothetical protein
MRAGYSGSPIAFDEAATAEWLFYYRGPRRQVFVAGVEEKATLHKAGRDM